MGMYGPHTDTFTRSEVEDIYRRAIHLERLLLNAGLEVPEPTYREASIMRRIFNYASPQVYNGLPQVEDNKLTFVEKDDEKSKTINRTQGNVVDYDGVRAKSRHERRMRRR